MKKIIFTIAVLVALEGLALAANGVPVAPFTFKQSNNVTIYYDAAATGAQSYIVNSKHSSGDRIYSSSNNTSNIWYKTVTVGALVSTGMTTIGESTFSGWSSQ